MSRKHFVQEQTRKRYTSDTAKKCVTVTQSVSTPTFTQIPIRIDVTSLPPVRTRQYVNQQLPEIGKLPLSRTFDLEVLHVFHYASASVHPNGVVASGNPTGDGMTYQIDLRGEPGGVGAFVPLHPERDATVQSFGFDMTAAQGGQDVAAVMRVRQYTDASGDKFNEVMGWTPVELGKASAFSFPVDPALTRAGGITVAELRFDNKNVGGFFDLGTKVIFVRPYVEVPTYTVQTRVVNICEERDPYRFGFNGQEKDNELKGLGNSIDFGARMYDSRIGRWLSLDPLAAKYPGLSPFQFAANNPILHLDPDGRIIRIFYKDDAGNSKYYDYGSKMSMPNNAFVQNTLSAIKTESGNSVYTAGVVKDVSKSSQVVGISEDETLTTTAAQENMRYSYSPATVEIVNKEISITWNPTAALNLKKSKDGEPDVYEGARTPGQNLGHELDHALLDINVKNKSEVDAKKTPTTDGTDNVEEKRVVGNEQSSIMLSPNYTPQQTGTRNNHRGRFYTSQGPNSITPADGKTTIKGQSNFIGTSQPDASRVQRAVVIPQR